MSEPATSIVVGDDLELRAWESGDVEAMFALVEANRAHLRRWLPWVDSTLTMEDERAAFARVQLQAERKDGVQYTIREHGVVAGAIGHVHIDWGNRATEIGYWVAEEAQGRGLVTRSTRALVRDAFDGLGLHRVVIRCATGNARSAAVPRRLGFTLEGTERAGGWLYDHFEDYLVFSMLAPEWASLQGAQ